VSHPARLAAPAAHRALADESLLDLFQVLTPEERLHWNDRAAAAILELRQGFATAEPDHAAGATGGERD